MMSTAEVFLANDGYREAGDKARRSRLRKRRSITHHRGEQHSVSGKLIPGQGRCMVDRPIGSSLRVDT